MPVDFQRFLDLASRSPLLLRDVVLDENSNGGNSRIRFSGFFRFRFSRTVRDKNDAVMRSFRESLSSKFGAIGEHAFDSILGTRMQLHKSLKTKDIRKVYSTLTSVRAMHLKNELTRLIETDPRVVSGGPALRRNLMAAAQGINFSSVNVDTEWSENLVDTARRKLDEMLSNPFVTGVAVSNRPFAGNMVRTSNEIRPDEAMGLSSLQGMSEPVFKSHETSVEDRVRAGKIGVGMRVNSSLQNPVLFQKLKTNGVEPGFIFKKDWSANDTMSLMLDIYGSDSVQRLNALAGRQPDAAMTASEIRQEGLDAGRTHPAAVAFAAEEALMRDIGRPDTKIGRAFAERFPDADAASLFG